MTRPAEVVDLTALEDNVHGVIDLGTALEALCDFGGESMGLQAGVAKGAAAVAREILAHATAIKAAHSALLRGAVADLRDNP